MVSLWRERGVEVVEELRARGGMAAIRDLEDALGVSSRALRRVVSVLAEQGLVEVRVSLKDTRCRVLCLVQNGE